MSTDLLLVAAIALGCSLVAPLLAVPLLRVLRPRPIRVWAAVVVVVAVVAVAAGVVGSATAMFISQHDLDVVLLVVAVSAVAAMGTALLLGRPLTRASAALTAVAARIGQDDYLPLATPPTAELASLGATLNASHTRLVASRERERALEASRRELVAWISHDLRTPIAGIRAISEALRDEVVTDPDSVARYHEVMVANSERLTMMVDDLFELSRLHSGALELTLERVRLADVVSDAVAAADALALAKGVRLHGADVDAAAHVSLDVAEVSRVLTNLLTNAIRHTPSDGTVAVSAHLTDATAVLAVADSCGGVPEQDLPRLFETGFRGEKSRPPVAAAGGSGIGLAIVRGIVQAHGGEVSVHNTDRGCQFVVALPAAS